MADANDSQHKLDVLRRAYRVLKADYEQRDAALAAERAAHAATLADNHALVARAEAAERALLELKASVRERARTASATLQRHAAERDAAAEASVVTSASSAAPEAAGDSYQRGMVWANRVMKKANLFSAALSTSIESVSTLAVPLATQQRLDWQEELLEAHAEVLQAAYFEAEEMEKALIRLDLGARAEREAGARRTRELASEYEAAVAARAQHVADVVNSQAAQQLASAQLQAEQYAHQAAIAGQQAVEMLSLIHI